MYSSLHDGLWPRRPVPLPDESFSSWFRRLANANGLPASELYAGALPGSYLNRQDLDRTAGPDLIRALSNHTGVDALNMQERTFARWGGRIFEEDDGRCRLDWLPPIGSEKARRSFGQQYCPACLASDEVPYFRLQWRLRFVALCPIHHCQLADRCPVCSAPIYTLRVLRQDHTLCCRTCGTDLAMAPVVPVSEEDILAHSSFMTVLDEGWAVLNGWGPLYGLAYFQLSMILFRLLASGPLARPLRIQIADGMEEQVEANQLRLAKEVMLLKPEQRLPVLKWVHRFLSSWPDRFLDACRAVHAYPSDLMKDPSSAPFVFWEPVVRSLAASARYLCPEELCEAKAYCERRGIPPTLGNLSALVGNELIASRRLLDPSPHQRSCGTGRYWRLEGIAHDVRAAVRAAAHQDGENIANWVEKALREKLRERNFRG